MRLRAGIRVRHTWNICRLASAIICIAGASVGVAAVGSAGIVRAAVPPPILPATLWLRFPSQAIPRSFLGLSMAYNQVTAFANEGSAFDHFVSLIRPEDGGPMLLRIGGRSADRAYWDRAPVHAPASVYEIGHRWLRGLSALAARDRLHVLLDLNLAVHSRTLASNFVGAALRALPHGSLAGLEIGNEPDRYWTQPNLDRERIGTTERSTPRNWALQYSTQDYRRDYATYASRLRSKFPSIALGGPDVARSTIPWLSSIQGLGRDSPQFLTIHKYASSSGWPRGSRWYPSIGLFLSETSTSGLAVSVRTASAFAHSHHEALRVSEMNTISSGKLANIAESFATALWVPDVLFELIRAGADGVNWQTRTNRTNEPFRFTERGIKPMPELYGLAVFAEMTGPGARILNTDLVTANRLHLKAWAVRLDHGLRVLLINKGPQTASVSLHLGAVGTAYVKHLRAPGVGARTGVTFGGQTIGPNGRWHGREVAVRMAGRAGVYNVRVPGYNAALVSAR